MHIKTFLTHLRRVFMLATLILLLGCADGADRALGLQSVVQSKAWWMDRSQQAELPAVLGVSDWQDFKDWNSFGFGPEPVWLRLRLTGASTDTSQPWMVRIGPAFLDHVTLYDPMAGLTLRAGDAIAPTQEDLLTLEFSFEIPALAQERDVYLRLHTNSARTLFVDVQPYRAAKQAQRKKEGFLGFILSMSAIFSLWAVMHWWLTRERVMGVFAVKQVVSTLWAFFFLGFARVYLGPWLAPGVLSAIASALVPLGIACALWFLGTLIQTYQPSKTLVRICFGVAAVLAFLPLAQWAGLTRASLLLCNLTVPVMSAMLVITLLSAVRSKANVPIRFRYLMAYLLVYGVLNSLRPATHVGWIENSPILQVSHLAHVVLDGLVVFVMLQIRSIVLRRTQHEKALELARTREQMAAEKRLREEQSQLFSMLAHEMKTPLATLRMWLAAGQPSYPKMVRTITDINLIIERCVQSGQLADHGLQLLVEAQDAVALTQDNIQACREPERVDFERPPGLAPLRADTQMLSIVLSNLIDNACKYGQPGSRVALVLEPWVQGTQPGWRWCVTNQTGPAGLPDASRLFEKYYRSAQARRQSGSGLGLFLVRRLLSLMQGCIGYEPGATEVRFWVWLPAAPAPSGGLAHPTFA